MTSWLDGLVVVLAVAAGTLRLATPLILCAMGGLFSERAGVIDLGLEGKMLAAAFAAAASAAVTGSAAAGLAAGCVAALGLALVHGYASISHGGNQVVSGMAVNMLASGLTVVFGEAWFRQGGVTPALSAAARFLPLAGDVAPPGWPPLAASAWRLLLGHNLLVYAAILSVPLTAAVLARTRFGLRLRAAGEDPRAVDTAGVRVGPLRYRAVLISGLFTGVAGAYLSLAQNAGFTREMTAGQGYIALAALIFGKWRAWPALAACLLFGFIDAVAIRLQGVRLPGLGEVPVQAIQILPYALTVLLLAGFVGRALAPRAIGLPYPERR